MNDLKISLDFLEMRHIMIHLYQKMFHKVLETYRITQLEMDILLFLANNPEYDTATDLVKRRHLTKSHVSKSIDALVKQGYLTRSYEENNRKVIHLQLLPGAMDIISAGRACQKQFLTQMNQNISQEDAEIADRVLKELIHNAKMALTNMKEEDSFL